MESLQGKTAIVTGASSGIGAAIAKGLAKEGTNVVLVARGLDKLNEVKEEITNDVKDETKVMAIQADMSVQSEVEAVVKKAKTEIGAIDFLVNSAGQMKTATVRSGEVEEWDQMIDVNIKGVLYGINAVLPSLVEQGSGHIVNIASVSGLEVTKTSTVYSATKHAVRAISMGLEKELAQTGVRVTNISPGMVDTDLARNHRWEDRKMLEATDIANAVIYALTQPSYVNVNEITMRPV